MTMQFGSKIACLTRSIALLLVLCPHAAAGAATRPSQLIVRFLAPPTSDELTALSTELPIASWRSMRHVPHPKGDPNGTHPLAYVRVATLSDPASSVGTSS